MIHITGTQVKFKGSFTDLMREAAFGIHSLASAASKQVTPDDNLTPDDVYNESIKEILNTLTNIKKFDPTGDKATIPEELAKEFKKKAVALSKKLSKDKDTISIYSDSNLSESVRNASSIIKDHLKIDSPSKKKKKSKKGKKKKKDK